MDERTWLQERTAEVIYSNMDNIQKIDYINMFVHMYEEMKNENAALHHDNASLKDHTPLKGEDI